MDSRAIRQTFLSFFLEREHVAVPSSSLVPNDPTLLLTNAGMNQFKPYFLGEQQPSSPRAVSIQKCFRTTDIDEVGKTPRHLTFFEMLGNFSFGEYYKEKACPWSWQLVTDGWGIDPDRLWVTVYDTDDEAFDVWTDGVGVRPERVVRRGGKDNFWSMSVAGPCGPCSEIFVDLGDAFGPEAPNGPADNEDRYLEIWNLVFMQNECNSRIEPVAELPKKNIDTGAGVERIALVLQQVSSVYETDMLGGLVHAAEELTDSRYGTDTRTDAGLRILADHARAVTFLIADGVLPSNEERGYVLRRVMRRAVRHARLLGRDEPVLRALVDTTVDLMGDFYPEIAERRDFVIEVAAREEERFDSTLRQGLTLLEKEIASAGDGGKGISGAVAFRLHDTFGFPVDLTSEIAGEAGLGVDVDAFEVLMEEQRTRARAARRTETGGSEFEVFATLTADGRDTEFVGHEHLSSEGTVLAIARDGTGVQVAGEEEVVEVVLDRTPFYPEGGGQVGDRGRIKAPSGTGEVVDTRRIVPGVIAHHVQVNAGEIVVGDRVECDVDARSRRGAERAHTATHILHWILRDRLGEHARQAGSLVEPGRLRFDFNHFDALNPTQVADVERELQERVLTDDYVTAYETSYDFARSIGAMAIFGEKYGDFVRVVEVGDYSKELCGGTHVPHTSRVGVVAVTSEGSVGANLRRVEALVGEEGLEHLRRRADVLERAAELLKTQPDEVAERVERLIAAQKDMEHRLAEIDRRSATSEAEELARDAADLDGTRLVVARKDDAEVDHLRALAQAVKGRLGSGIVILGARGEGRANLVGAVSKDLADRGVSARDLLRSGAELLGGGAGGKAELAVSGGPNADRLDDAIAAAEHAAREALD